MPPRADVRPASGTSAADAPVDPVGPAGPSGPAAPIDPAASVGPAGPSGPVAPVDPAAPVGAAVVLRQRTRVRLIWLAVVLVVLVLLALASIALGSRAVGWGGIVGALTGNVDGFDQAAVAKRMPRTVLAMLSGAALAISGCVMQGVTRNPLADPGILGVNTGATLAVVIGMAFFSRSDARSMTWMAIIGAAAAAAAVYVIGSLGRGGATPLKLALAGAATTAALSSLVTAVVLPRGDIAGGVRSWQIGGVGGGTWASLLQVWPFLAAGFVLCLATARGLDSLALGDDLAAGLGEHVAATRLLASLGAVLLCGAITSVTGPIAFVGLVVPHACRLMAGVSHRWLILFSALVGACLLTFADVLGRLVARPGEIDVGIITALIGAPVFIAVVRHQKVRAL